MNTTVLPHFRVAIINYRMSYVVSLDSRQNIVRQFFIFKFCTVDTNLLQKQMKTINKNFHIGVQLRAVWNQLKFPPSGKLKLTGSAGCVLKKHLFNVSKIPKVEHVEIEGQSNKFSLVQVLST